MHPSPSFLPFLPSSLEGTHIFALSFFVRYLFFLLLCTSFGSFCPFLVSSIQQNNTHPHTFIPLSTFLTHFNFTPFLQTSIYRDPFFESLHVHRSFSFAFLALWPFLSCHLHHSTLFTLSNSQDLVLSHSYTFRCFCLPDLMRFLTIRAILKRSHGHD
jgi:hypothetical protein